MYMLFISNFSTPLIFTLEFGVLFVFVSIMSFYSTLWSNCYTVSIVLPEDKINHTSVVLTVSIVLFRQQCF